MNLNSNNQYVTPSTPCAYISRAHDDKFVTPPNAPIKARAPRKLVDDNCTPIHCNIAKKLTFGEERECFSPSPAIPPPVFIQPQHSIFVQQQQPAQKQQRYNHVHYAAATPMSQEKQFFITNGNDEKKRCFGEYRQTHTNSSSLSSKNNVYNSTTNNGQIIKRRKV